MLWVTHCGVLHGIRFPMVGVSTSGVVRRQRNIVGDVNLPGPV